VSLNVVKKVIFDVVKTFGLPIFPCILFLRLLKLTSPCSWSRPCCGLCMCMCVCVCVCGGGSITCVCVCVCRLQDGNEMCMRWQLQKQQQRSGRVLFGLY